MKSRATQEHRGRPREFSPEKALDAATRVFGDKGFEETSLSDLTKAMDINRPSMYSAFGNKEQLYRKALARYSDAGDKQVADCLAGKTARESVDRLLRKGVSTFTGSKGGGGCFVTQPPPAGSSASEATRKEVARRRRGVERELRKRFDRALEEGELPREVSTEDLARFYSVLVQGIALQAQHGGTRKQLLRVVETAMQGWPGKRMPGALDQRRGARVGWRAGPR
jgi:AcrR family transcriptional regulator